MGYRIKTINKPTVLDDAELVSGLERFWLKLEENRRAVLGGIILAITAVIAVGGALYYDHLQGDKAKDLYRQATQLSQERPIGQPAKADENIKKAIGLYKQVIEQYPRTSTAQLALYDLGNAMVQINDLSGAIEAYKKYLSGSQSNTSLVGLVHQRLAFAYLLNGERDQATKHFQAVLEMQGALNKDQALFEIGKLEESQSRPEGALARYQDLVKNYPASPFAAEAEVRIKALGGKTETPSAQGPSVTTTPVPGTVPTPTDSPSPAPK